MARARDTLALRLLYVVLLSPAKGEAARPMVTDDARVVDPKSCQVESWARRNRDSTELWAMPACNPFGFFELTYGGARTFSGGASAFSDNIAQAKAIFRELEPDNWGVGFAIGSIRHPDRDVANGLAGDGYFYVPLSIALFGDRWVVHLNGGVLNRRDIDKRQATWGFGHEIRLRDDLFFIPEVFATDNGRPFYQVGLRHWFVKDRVQVDATFGNRAVSDARERWFSIGLRLLSPPFIP